MVKFPRRRCQAPSCSNFGTHGISGPEHCEIHALESERDLVSRPCKNCCMEYILQNGLCQACGFWKLHGSLHLFKQREVEKALIAAGQSPHQVDKIIDCGVCGRERPDFMWDAGTHWVILEVDESQHLSNPEECECIRMVNIFSSLGMPVLFIRYNPDKYRQPDKQRRTEGESQRARHATLMRWVKWARTHEGAQPKGRVESLRFVQLFFDGWNGAGKLENVKTL